jgi:hypothetical protein
MQKNDMITVDKGAASTSSPPASRATVAKVRDAVLHDRHEPGWAMHHATYTEQDMDSVKVVHRKLSGFGDHLAAFMVGMMRYVFDVATRYPKHHKRFPRVKESKQNALVKVGLPRFEEKMQRQAGVIAKGKAELPEEMELDEMRKRHLCFGPDDWLTRIVFLESVAGVPGMVAAAVRHLHSLRLLRRDKGWINTMLADAANERQHLLVALKLYEPGIVMRSLLLVTQGVFWNFFFIFYLMAPRVAHRFVGVLEEEAVVTYSRIIDDINQGRLPEWEDHPAPRIAIDYWGLQSDAKILDVMRALRADEANHRYVNHTLAELKADDFNPFAYGDAKPIERGVNWGLTRDEAIAYFEGEDAKRRMPESQSPPAPSSPKMAGDDAGKSFPGREGIPA